MTTEELRKAIIDSYLKLWVKKPDTWVWNIDGTISVEGDVFIPEHSYPFTKLLVKFDIVTGDFDCSGNKIETLENFPNLIKRRIFSKGNPYCNTIIHYKYLEEHVGK